MPFCVEEHDDGHLMWRIGMPVVLGLGTVGNIVVMWYLHAFRLGSNFTVFFMILCICDMCALYTDAIPRWIITQFGFNLATVATISCKFQNWFKYSFAMLSVWLLTGMVVQRAVYELWPLLTRRVDISRQTEFVITLLLCINFSLNSHTVLDLTVVNGTCTWSNLFEDKVLPVYTWLDMLLYAALPTVIIITGDCAILKALRNRAVRAAEREKARKLAGNRKISVVEYTRMLHPKVLQEPKLGSAGQADQRDPRSMKMLTTILQNRKRRGSILYHKVRNETSQTLLAITVTFMGLTLPYRVVKFLADLDPALCAQHRLLLWDITHMLLHVNYAVKPYILFLARLIYQEEFHTLLNANI